MVKAKVYILKKHFDGLPKVDDLELQEEDLPAIKDGEFLAEAIYLSVDPYMRAYAPGLPLGTVFIGSQVANNTAYFGFLEICQPKQGDTVVVSGAAGAVGSVVGQIAKIKGCTVIGIAGSEEKGKWLLNDLGFDHFINYKTADIDKALSEVAPNGVDCYFDNVGGETTSITVQHMKDFGRISVCGAISNYNEKEKTVPLEIFRFVTKQIKLEGFAVTRWLDRYTEGIEQNLKWIKEDKLKYRETLTEGFENMPTAFIEMLQGKNFGKAVVKV